MSALGPALALLTFLPLPIETSAQSLTGGPQSLLSRPLPGTLARDDYDLARSLEEALVGFQGIEAARVVLTRTETDETAPRYQAAVQLALGENVRPQREWLNAVADFIAQAVPGSDRTALTMVEAAGRTLYSGGTPRLLDSPTPPTKVTSAEPPSPWLLPGAAAVGLLAAAAAVLMRRGAGRTRAAEAASGPLAFMGALSGRELAMALGGERPAVVAAVLAELPEGARRRAVRALGRSRPPGPASRPSGEVLAAVGVALRRKLAEARLS